MRILGRLFDKFPSLHDNIEMYTGSSAGGLVASALATHSYDEAKKCTTQEQFARIFHATICRDAYSADGWQVFDSVAVSYILRR